MDSEGEGRDKEKQKGTKTKWVTGVKVEIRKDKRVRSFLKEKRRKYEDQPGSKKDTIIIPRQRRLKSCSVF